MLIHWHRGDCLHAACDPVEEEHHVSLRQAIHDIFGKRTRKSPWIFCKVGTNDAPQVCEQCLAGATAFRKAWRVWLRILRSVEPSCFIMGCGQCRGVKPGESRGFRSPGSPSAHVLQSEMELIPLLHSDLEICVDDPRRRTFSAQIVWPAMVKDAGRPYPFAEDAEDGLLLNLKLAGDEICQEIRLAPVEKFPAAENIVEHTITVESNEDVLAFCCDEVRDEGGGALYYHPHVIIRAHNGPKTTLRMEPLSGCAVWPAPRRRGRRISLPDIEVKHLDIFKPLTVDPDDAVPVPIDGFRCLRGQRRDHITGVQWSQSSNNTSECGNMSQHVKVSTGQTVMFWFELICLDLVRASLSAQIADSGDFFQVTEAATSAFVQANYLVCALSGVEAFADLNLNATDLGFLAASISLSCGMLGLGFASRDKSPSRVLGLPGKKTDWDLEFLMLILVRSTEVLSRVFGISLVHISTRFANFKLGGPVMILAMAFSSRLLFRNATAADVLAAVVAHPGQLLEPASLLPFHASLFLDGMLALTLIICQILVRNVALFAEHSKAVPKEALGAWLALTAFSCVGRSFFAYYLGGKVESPTFKRLATESGPEDKIEKIEISYSALPAAFNCPKEVPVAILAAMPKQYLLSASVREEDADWLAGPAQTYLRKLRVPQSSRTGAEGTSALLLSVANCVELEDLNLDYCDKIPADAWKQLGEARWCRWVRHAPPFLGQMRGVGGRKDLNLDDCPEIPADAWKQLGEARWVNLKTASFSGCFKSDTRGARGAAVLLLSLAKCVALEDLNLDDCPEIPADAWTQLEEASWVNLKKASFSWCLGAKMCFSSGTEGADGAAVLLLSLAKCVALEERCEWLNLKKASFLRCFKSDTIGADGCAMLLLSLAKCVALEEPCASVRAQRGQMGPPCSSFPWPDALRWRNVVSCDFWRSLFVLQPEGSPLGVLLGDPSRRLEAAGRSQVAEPQNGIIFRVLQFGDQRCRWGGRASPFLGQMRGDLQLECCWEIPADAWKQLGEARCFGARTKGAKGAAVLLLSLAKCVALEDLDLDGCDKIPADAWKQLPRAPWPALRKSNGIPDFVELRNVPPSGYCSTSLCTGAKHLRSAQCSGLFSSNDPPCDPLVLLLSLAKSVALEDLNLDDCPEIPADAWKQLGEARCFNSDATGTDGAAVLLLSLAKCAALEERCECFNSDATGTDGAAVLLLSLAKCVALEERCECFNSDATGTDGAAVLLLSLAKCVALEERCEWLNLKKASFYECFNPDTKGAKGAAVLLLSLAKCVALEEGCELYFAGCEKIPADAWKQLPRAVWPSLLCSNGIPDFLELRNARTRHWKMWTVWIEWLPFERKAYSCDPARPADGSSENA
eukprot:s253_g10.t1